ncbi:MAG: DUF362 domain-containing protein [Deltaproteobacteria bacterium]|nr:DUF362 domain-containing protein [Deltaproteobacteria bacterium]
MNRRKFLKSSIKTALGVATLGASGGMIERVFAGEDNFIAVATGPSPARITEGAVGVLGGMRRFISRGDVVVVKPNIGWDRAPEYAATTNPEVVATLVRLSYDAGAKIVKVFDRTVNDARRCYVQSGIADAARASGAEVSFIDDRKFKEVTLPGIALSDWTIYTDILEADKVINVPIAKTHGLSTLTLGMKNLMGVMGGWRSLIHQKIDGSIVDLTLAVKPALTVIDAVRILTDNGPQGGSLKDVKRLDTIIAGTDPVAVDAYGTTLFGMKGEDFRYLRLAERAGLGSMNVPPQRLRIIRI